MTKEEEDDEEDDEEEDEEEEKSTPRPVEREKPAGLFIPSYDVDLWIEMGLRIVVQQTPKKVSPETS